MRWRRLCIDVDDYGEVIGGSVEHYTDRKTGPDTVAVLARSVWSGRSPEQLLADELELGWPQLTLPFVMIPPPPSA